MTSIAHSVYSASPYYFEKTCRHLQELTLVAAKTAEKVANFVKRHQKEFFVYGTTAALLFACSVSFSKVLVTLLPGFAYQLAFTSGEELATDILHEMKLDSIRKPKREWMPLNESEAEDNESLLSRLKVCQNLMHQLKDPEYKGWCLLYGETSVGKTATLNLVGEELVKKGHRVFFLKAENLLGGPFKGVIDARFRVMVLYINAVALWARFRKQPPPVLVIDEFRKMFDINNVGMGGRLKATTHFPLNFNVLAVGIDQDKGAMHMVDAALMSRFIGKEYRLPCFDEPAILMTLSKVKGAIFNPSVTDDHVYTAIIFTRNIQPNLRMKLVFDLLKGEEDFGSAESGIKIIQERIRRLDEQTQNLIYFGHPSRK